MTIHSPAPVGDLSRRRIDRDSRPPRRRLPWAVLALIAAAAAAVYPSARSDGVVIKNRAEVGQVSENDLAKLTAATGDRPQGQTPGSDPRSDSQAGRSVSTLRAPGFSRLRSVTAFLAESVALAVIGGIIGCVLALPVHGLSTGAMNMTSFSELAFKFRITPGLLLGGLLFSALMGAAGGLLPAIRAARIPVARALREI